MSDHDTTIRPAPQGSFRHEAMFYGDLDPFVALVVTFVEGARKAAEPVLVAVAEPRIDLLRAALAGDDRSGASPSVAPCRVDGPVGLAVGRPFRSGSGRTTVRIHLQVDG